MKRDDISVFKGLSVMQSQTIQQVNNLYKVKTDWSLHRIFSTKWKKTIFDRITYYGKAGVIDDKKLFIIQSKNSNVFYALLVFIRRYDSKFHGENISNTVRNTAAEMRDDVNWRVYA